MAFLKIIEIYFLSLINIATPHGFPIEGQDSSRFLF